MTFYEWFGKVQRFRDEEKDIYNRIMEVVNEEKRERLPTLRKINRRKLKEEVKKVIGVLEKVATAEITDTNTIIYAAAVIVTEELGLRREERDTKTRTYVETKT